MDELDTGKLRAVIADKIEAGSGPIFGSPEYLADPVKLARAEKRRRENAEAVAAIAVEAVADTIDTLRQQLAEARAATLEEAATIADEHAPGGEYYERDHDEGSMRGAIAKTLRNLASEASHD